MACSPTLENIITMMILVGDEDNTSAWSLDPTVWNIWTGGEDIICLPGYQDGPSTECQRTTWWSCWEKLGQESQNRLLLIMIVTLVAPVQADDVLAGSVGGESEFAFTAVNLEQKHYSCFSSDEQQFTFERMILSSGSRISTCIPISGLECIVKCANMDFL